MGEEIKIASINQKNRFIGKIFFVYYMRGERVCSKSDLEFYLNQAKSGQECLFIEVFTFFFIQQAVIEIISVLLCW